MERQKAHPDYFLYFTTAQLFYFDCKWMQKSRHLTDYFFIFYYVCMTKKDGVFLQTCQRVKNFFMEKTMENVILVIKDEF